MPACEHRWSPTQAALCAAHRRACCYRRCCRCSRQSCRCYLDLTAAHLDRRPAARPRQLQGHLPHQQAAAVVQMLGLLWPVGLTARKMSTDQWLDHLTTGLAPRSAVRRTPTFTLHAIQVLGCLGSMLCQWQIISTAITRHACALTGPSGVPVHELCALHY